MYDLCTRPEQPQQPEQASAGTEMEGRGEPEAPGQQHEGEKTEQQGTHDLVDKTNPATTTITVPATPTAMLGKRHHSLYENLNGCEVEGFRKVGLELVVYL